MHQADAGRNRTKGRQALKRTLGGITAGFLLASSMSVPAHAVLAETGPVDEQHGFPAWFTDANNLRLELCLDGPYCLATAERPNPEDAVDFQTNFPGEAFWWAGEASMSAGSVNALLVLAQEAAFANEEPVNGDQVAFSRVRIRVDGLTPGGTYTITHPYGTETLTADGFGVIAETEDIGCFDTPCSQEAYKRAANGTVGPFLRWESGAPAGYLGDPNQPHSVVGSPTGNNFFELSGPGLSTPLRTNLFAIQGKLAATQGTIALGGAIGAKHATVSALVGNPLGNELTNQRFGGAYQKFERGTITWLPGAGAYALAGGIHTVWNRIGGQDSDLGYPTSDEYAPIAGGVMQDFQFGKISWNPATGSRITKGGIGFTWDAAGGPRSGLGYPISDETGGLVRGGAKQVFQGGEVVWSPAAGARIVMGGIRSAWAGQGSESGRLGYPTSGEYAAGGGAVAQDFQGGRITWRSGSITIQ